MSAAARVFLVQEPLRMQDGVPVPRINYGSLKPYGELRFLFQWGEVKDEHALAETAPLIEKLRGQLRDFTDRDFIVPIGNPALIGMAVTVAADANDGRVKVLDWIRDAGCYRVVDIDFDCEETT